MDHLVRNRLERAFVLVNSRKNIEALIILFVCVAQKAVRAHNRLLIRLLLYTPVEQILLRNYRAARPGIILIGVATVVLT
jgi:hypothetical protein